MLTSLSADALSSHILKINYLYVMAAINIFLFVLASEVWVAVCLEHCIITVV